MSDEFKDFSFESILAEVKGSAFIDGDKKTPPDLLQEKADRILREAEEQSEPRTISSATALTSSSMSDMFDIINEYDDNSADSDTENMPIFSEKIDLNSNIDSSIFEPDFFETETNEPPMIISPLDDENIVKSYSSVPVFGTAMDTIEEMPTLTPTVTAPIPPPPEPTPQPVRPSQTDMESEKNELEDTQDFVFPSENIQAGYPDEPKLSDHVKLEVFNQDSADTNDQDDEVKIYKEESSTTDDQEPTKEASSTPVIMFDQFRDKAHNVLNEDPTKVQETKVFSDDYFNDDSFVDELPDKKPKWSLAGLFNRGATSSQKRDMDSSMSMIDGQSAETEDKLPEEPPLKHAIRKFAIACNSISIRVIPAAIITIIMLVLTFTFEAGLIIPFGIGQNLDYAAGILIISLLIVMMLCSDVLVRGFDFLVKGEPNAETLILFSCAFSIISAAFTMITDMALLLPFNAVSALSLTFAALAEKYNLRAITDSLKNATGSSEPYGVQAEYNKDIDRTVLKKVYNRTNGFYNNLMQPDITEITYRFAAPVLLIASLLLTLIIVIFREGVLVYSLHILSALLAAAAPFSALLAFSIPFATVVRATRGSGVALAGWGGADDIYYTDGVCVTDDDLFPPGMLKLSGVKVYDGASPEDSISYTASLIISSGSGLSNLFTEVLKQQGLNSLEIEDFECHESGISAKIKGQKVATGSAAFMNLQGVRVPDDTNMKNAVYTSVDSRLVAMFAIDYKPLPSVQSALISMLKWRIDLYFAMRDFNVTPSMVGQKFKVPFDSFVFIPAKDSYRISDLHTDEPGQMSAILSREGLNPFAESITSGRLLRSAAFFASILSIASAALGVMIMFYIYWTGAFLSASPGNLVIFMLCMLATVLIVCGYVRLKK